MVGIVHSSYYRTPSLGKKGKTASKLSYNKINGWVNQEVVVQAIKKVLTRIIHQKSKNLNVKCYI